jgi:hypothetical protein
MNMSATEKVPASNSLPASTGSMCWSRAMRSCPSVIGLALRRRNGRARQIDGGHIVRQEDNARSEKPECVKGGGILMR